MGSIARRARRSDIDRILALVNSRRYHEEIPESRSGQSRTGGLIEGPSRERLEQAVDHDIVVVAVRGLEIVAVAIVMREETFKRTPWWELRAGLTHPDLDDVALEDRSTAYFELLIGPEGAADRRPVIRAAYEALWAASIDHDFFAAATVHAPFMNLAAQRLLTAIGFVEVGMIEYVVGDVNVVTKIQALSGERLRETIGSPEVSGLLRGMFGDRLKMPPLQSSPAAWRGDTISSDRWITELDEQQIGELRRAVAGVESSDDLAALTAADAPLPQLSSRLADLRHELLGGVGFVLVRGLPVAEMEPLERAACFYVIGLHLGHPRMQNSDGDLLGHVRDLGLASSDPNVRIYQTHERQTFHTDSTDVVGLCCIRPAAQGGDSMLVSALTIYNEMVCECPELAARLFEPLATDRRGEVPDGAKPFFEIPPLTWFGSKLSVLYQRQYIESASRFDDAPPLSSETRRALDRFDELANDPELSLAMRLESGDMQFVNNHALLHDRTAFTDGDAGGGRHLLRLWLSMPGDRPLPPVYAERYGSVEIGNRGGIAVAGARPRIRID